MEISGGYLITEKSEWKEDGKFKMLESGIEGEILDEEISPWLDITVEENDEINTYGLLHMQHMI